MNLGIFFGNTNTHSVFVKYSALKSVFYNNNVIGTRSYSNVNSLFAFMNYLSVPTIFRELFYVVLGLCIGRYKQIYKMLGKICGMKI